MWASRSIQGPESLVLQTPTITLVLSLDSAAKAVVDAYSVDPPRQEWELFVPN